MPACATPFHPPTACLLQGLEPPLGEEVQLVTNRVIFITAVSGGEGREGGGEWRGGRAQRSGHSGWLSKLGLAQQEASSLELEPEPGLPAHRDPSPHPLAHLLPATCLQIRSKGAPPTFPCLLLPPASVWVGPGWGGSGWAQAPPSPERLLKLRERERGGGMFAPARADPTEVNIIGLVASCIPQAHLLPTVHFCLFFGRIL